MFTWSQTVVKVLYSNANADKTAINLFKRLVITY